MEGLLENPADAFDFMMAGNSTVTIKSVKTGKHFTYKVKKHREKELRFVSVLYDGDDNYNYIGCIFEAGAFKHTKGSKCLPTAESFRAFNWTWANVRKLTIPDYLEIWHEGRCGRCGRKLTEPESIRLGIGPICREK